MLTLGNLALFMKFIYPGMNQPSNLPPGHDFHMNRGSTYFLFTFQDGFFGLSDTNVLGCEHCNCDVGGTDLKRGELPVCDKGKQLSQFIIGDLIFKTLCSLDHN